MAKRPAISVITAFVLQRMEGLTVTRRIELLEALLDLGLPAELRTQLHELVQDYSEIEARQQKLALDLEHRDGKGDGR